MRKYVSIKSTDEKIVEVILNRVDKANALNKDMLVELNEFFREIMDERYIVIIRGEGNKYFSAGADIESLYNGELNVVEIHKYFDIIEEYPHPVIAMVNGYCFGAACELIAACDLRTASSKSLFGITPAKLGLTYSIEGIERVIKLIGYSKAKLLFLTGKTITSEEALRYGLVDYVYDPDILEEETIRIARELAENAPLSMESIKRVFNLIRYQKAYDETTLTDVYNLALESRDYREGLKAFLEKRKPLYRGK